jgi:hypothetical protein
VFSAIYSRTPAENIAAIVKVNMLSNVLEIPFTVQNVKCKIVSENDTFIELNCGVKGSLR